MIAIEYQYNKKSKESQRQTVSEQEQTAFNEDLNPNFKSKLPFVCRFLLGY